MIPNKIPIPTPSLDDHLRATAEKLITLLTHQSKNVGPYIKSSTKDDLLRLATILHRDKTPKITLPLSSTTSEGAPSTHTSEGAPITLPSEGADTTSTSSPNLPLADDVTVVTSNTSKDNQSSNTTAEVTTINTNTPALPTHASLYPTPPSTKSTSTSTKLPSLTKNSYSNPFKSLDNLIDKNVEVIDKHKFNKFLRSYIRHNKKSTAKTPTKTTMPLPPKPHRLRVPFPKASKPTTPIRPVSSHPMRLRCQRVSSSSPTEF